MQLVIPQKCVIRRSTVNAIASRVIARMIISGDVKLLTLLSREKVGRSQIDIIDKSIDIKNGDGRFGIPVGDFQLERDLVGEEGVDESRVLEHLKG